MAFSSPPGQQSKKTSVVAAPAIGEEGDRPLGLSPILIQRRLKSRLQRHCAKFLGALLDLEVFEVVTNRCGEAPVDQQ
jgi:hypothetical protein